jgi:hypothetical protein
VFPWGDFTHWPWTRFQNTFQRLPDPKIPPLVKMVLHKFSAPAPNPNNRTCRTNSKRLEEKPPFKNSKSHWKRHFWYKTRTKVTQEVLRSLLVLFSEGRAEQAKRCQGQIRNRAAQCRQSYMILLDVYLKKILWLFRTCTTDGWYSKRAPYGLWSPHKGQSLGKRTYASSNGHRNKSKLCESKKRLYRGLL